MSIILILAIVIILLIFVFILISNYNFKNKQNAKSKQADDKPKLTNEQKKQERLKKKEDRIKQKKQEKEKKEKESKSQTNHFMSIHDVIAKGNINANVKKPFQDNKSRLEEGESDNINYIDVCEDDEYDDDFVKPKTNNEKQEKYEELKDEALADEIRGLSDEMKALLFGDVLDKKN